MIEPYEQHKQCAWCLEVKPVDCFTWVRRGRERPRVRHSYCKSCRCERAKTKRESVGRPDRGAAIESPGAWKWPADSRPLYDKKLDVAARHWYMPEQGGQLRRAI